MHSTAVRERVGVGVRVHEAWRQQARCPDLGPYFGKSDVYTFAKVLFNVAEAATSATLKNTFGKKPPQKDKVENVGWGCNGGPMSIKMDS